MVEKESKKKWNFEGNFHGEQKTASPPITVRGILYMIMRSLNKDDDRPIIPLGHGDPSAFPCFRTSAAAEDAVVDALRSARYNSYSPTVGILPARRAIAGYLSHDLPYNLSPDDVYLTVGCSNAIEVIIEALARPGANILVPRPGFPYYDVRAACSNLEVRHYDLLPDKGWEVDLEAVEALSDENTVAMVIINPGNPCGNVHSPQHLEKIAEKARKLGILVIADEVYEQITFGSTKFVPMAAFAATVPVITLGSISKRWTVPGWRLGWLVTCDPTAALKNSGLNERITACLEVTTDPATFVQAAVPQILEKTKEEFYSNIIAILRRCADICFDRLQEIPCITCPSKPEGSMFLMVKLNLELLDDIGDDMEFCIKLAEEESVVVLPGVAVGMKNWLRVTFACDHSCLEDGLGRMKAFCQRHAKKH
ncbi:hypothetical protein ACFX2A_025907 [Malus domestica]